MSRLVTGFILGVLLTVAVFYFLNSRSSERVNRSPVSSDTEDPGPAEPKDELLPVPDPDSAGVEDAGPQPSVGQIEVLSIPEAEIPNFADGNAQKPAQAAVQRTTNTYTPSPEIASLLNERVPDKIHSKYEGEQKDDSWSTYMEAQINGYLRQKPALNTFQIPLVDCRVTICEIHAIGYGPRAYAVWTNEIADIPSQPWFEFNGMSGNAKEVQPDTVAIIVILHSENE